MFTGRRLTLPNFTAYFSQLADAMVAGSVFRLKSLPIGDLPSFIVAVHAKGAALAFRMERISAANFALHRRAGSRSRQTDAGQARICS